MSRLARATCAALLLPLVLAGLSTTGCATRYRWRGEEGAAHEIVNQSTISIAESRDRERYPVLGPALRDACAVFVFPRVASMGLGAGVSSGMGVLLVRDPASGHWSGPGFVSLSEADLGLQAGIARRELVVVLASCDGLQALADGKSSLRLGASPALQGAARAGTQESAGGTRAFSRVSGAWVGVALDGSRVRLERASAEAYFGRALRPGELFVPVEDEDSNPCEICLAIELAGR